MVLLLRTLWKALTLRVRPPLEALGTSVLAFRVWPNDLDVNIHMNNGRFLIEEELVAFGQWINTLKVRPTIVDLQSKFIEIKDIEIERYRYKVSEEELARMEHLTDRILKKILHHPIKMLKAPIDTVDSIPSRVNLVRNVFDLEEPNQSH